MKGGTKWALLEYIAHLVGLGLTSRLLWEEITPSPTSIGLRSSTEEHSPVKGVVVGANPIGDPMSYKKKKIKKGRFNWLKYKFGLVKIALLKAMKALLQKEGRVRISQTVTVIEFLRRQNKIIRSNNQRINEWVDEYLDDCKKDGEPVNILTQWCISKDLEERYRRQGNKFVFTKKERKLFEREMPRILAVFKENGFVVNWWITFNRSYLDSGRINPDLESEYKSMVNELLEEYELSNDVLLFDWEDDVLMARPQPDQEAIQDIGRFVSTGLFALELTRHSAWARDEAGLRQTDKELENDVKFQIACEISEGDFLIGEKSPFNDGCFIMVPLEVAERYDNFCIKAPDFKKRIVSVVSSYPWRLSGTY